MANDINLAKTGENIKHGSFIVASTPRNNKFSINNTYVFNNPIIADIENKYDARFDDITYYTIGSDILVGG